MANSNFFNQVPDTVHGNMPYTPLNGTALPSSPSMAAKGGKKWTPASDAKADKKAGIKPGSKRDNALDKKRGVPT